MKVLRCDTDMKNYFESTKLVTAKFPGINVRADEYVYSHLMFVIERMMMKGLKYRLIHEDCKRTCKNGSGKQKAQKPHDKLALGKLIEDVNYPLKQCNRKMKFSVGKGPTTEKMRKQISLIMM